MRVREVVTSFLRHEESILLLKRSDRVGTHRGKWAGVSGSIEAGEPLEQALREIREETGLTSADVELVLQGERLEVPDAEHGVRWRVHPFLFNVKGPAVIRLDWEHTESRWVEPSALARFDTVPMLEETWQRLSRR